MTTRELRDLLKELDDEQPVLVCLCGPEDAVKLMETAEANEDGDLVHVRVPLALQVAGGVRKDDGGLLLFVCASPEHLGDNQPTCDFDWGMEDDDEES